MATDCLFCRIVRGEIPASIVRESEDLVAFRDINPQAPVHLLLIPKRHIANLDDLKPEDAPIVAKLMLAAAELARREGIASDGYRVVMNCNANGGQTVFHLHAHLLGGRQLHWPPG
jgi:histidine triad (HIT) family protein